MLTQVRIGVGSILVLLSIASFILAIIVFTTETTTFTANQITTLQSWTTKMAFQSHILTAAGFSDSKAVDRWNNREQLKISNLLVVDTKMPAEFTVKQGHINAQSLIAESLHINEMKITGDSLILSPTTVSCTALTTPSLVSTSVACTGNVTINGSMTCDALSTSTLNCSTVTAGVWHGNVIDGNSGGTGLSATSTPYALFAGSSNGFQQLATGTTNQVLVSQGPAALPLFETVVPSGNGAYNASYTNLNPGAWSLVSTPDLFYTFIGNVYTIQGSFRISAAIPSPLIRIHVTFNVPVTVTAPAKGVFRCCNLTQGGINSPISISLDSGTSADLASLSTPLSGVDENDVFLIEYDLSYLA